MCHRVILVSDKYFMFAHTSIDILSSTIFYTNLNRPDACPLFTKLREGWKINLSIKTFISKYIIYLHISFKNLPTINPNIINPNNLHFSTFIFRHTHHFQCNYKYILICIMLQYQAVEQYPVVIFISKIRL